MLESLWLTSPIEAIQVAGLCHERHEPVTKNSIAAVTSGRIATGTAGTRMAPIQQMNTGTSLVKTRTQMTQQENATSLLSRVFTNAVSVCIR